MLDIQVCHTATVDAVILDGAARVNLLEPGILPTPPQIICLPHFFPYNTTQILVQISDHKDIHCTQQKNTTCLSPYTQEEPDTVQGFFCMFQMLPWCSYHSAVVQQIHIDDEWVSFASGESFGTSQPTRLHLPLIPRGVIPYS